MFAVAWWLKWLDRRILKCCLGWNILVSNRYFHYLSLLVSRLLLKLNRNLSSHRGGGRGSSKLKCSRKNECKLSSRRLRTAHLLSSSARCRSVHAFSAFFHILHFTTQQQLYICIACRIFDMNERWTYKL